MVETETDVVSCETLLLCLWRGVRERGRCQRGEEGGEGGGEGGGGEREGGGLFPV